MAQSVATRCNRKSATLADLVLTFCDNALYQMSPKAEARFMKNNNNTGTPATIQPVARPVMPRPVRVLVALVRLGKLDPSSVTEREEANLRTWAGRVERELIDKMRSLVAVGKVNKAKRKRRQYLCSDAAALRALLADLPKDLRAIDNAPREERDARRAEGWAAIVRNFAAVKDLTRPARPRVRMEPKRSGEMREIMSFPWIDQARMRLLDRAITPFVDFHPAQYALNACKDQRGREAACKALRQFMREVPPDYGVVRVDISNFYPSINTRWLEDKLGLPLNVIRSQIHTGGMRFRSAGHSPATARSRLPQGSAVAPRIAEWVMAHLLRDFLSQFPHLRIVVYADDMAILCRQDEASVIVNALRERLSSHEAGPFALRFPINTADGIWQPVRKEVSFLGYNFVRRGRVATAYLAADRIRGAKRHVGDMIFRPVPDFERARAYARGFAAANRLWSGAPELKDELTRLIDGVEEAHAARGGSDPVGYAYSLLQRLGRANPTSTLDGDMLALRQDVPRPKWRDWRPLSATP